MAVNIGPKIGIDGEKEYREEIKQIIAQGKALKAETEAEAAAFADANDEEEKAARVSKKLSEQIENQRKLVAKLEDAVKKSTEKTGENSTQTLAWKERLAKARTELSGMEAQARTAGKEVGSLADKEAQATEKTSVFGDVLKANLCSDVIKAGLTATARIVKDLAQGFANAIKETAAYADSIVTLGKKTGMSTDAIQEWTYMAGLIDVEFETIEGATKKLVKSMDAARDGSKAQTEAFENMGVSVVDANGDLRDSTAVFNDVLAALRQIENPTERDAAAMEILGKSAQELNPLIEMSAEELGALRKEAHDVGAVMDANTLKSLNRVQDGLDRMTASWESMKKQLVAKIGIKVLPDLEKLVGIMQDLAKTGDAGKAIAGITGLLQKEAKELPGNAKRLTKAALKIAKEVVKGVGDVMPDLLGALIETAINVVSDLPSLLELGLRILAGVAKGLTGGLVKTGESIATGIAGWFKDPVSEDVEAALEYVDELEKRVSAVTGLSEEMQRGFGNIEVNHKEAEYWLKMYEKLAPKTERSRSEHELLQTAIERLCELYPDLAGYIDRETGLFVINTDAIRENIKAYEDRAKAEIYLERARDVLNEIVDLEEQRREEQTKLAQAQTRYDDAVSDQKRIQALYDEAKALEGLGKARQWEKASEGLKAYAEAAGFTKDGIYELSAVAGYLGEDLNALDVAVAKADAEISGSNIKIEAQTKAIADLENGVKHYTDTAEECYAAAAASAETSAEETVEAFEDVPEKITKPVLPLPKEYFTVGKYAGKRLDDGVAEGIYANMDVIRAASRNTMTNAINEMKKRAQIKSPSRVTRDLIGKNLALGIVEGFDAVMTSAKTKQIFSMTPIFEDMKIATAAANISTTNNETINMGGVSIPVYARDGQSVDAIVDKVMIRMQRAVDQRKAVFQ